MSNGIDPLAPPTRAAKRNLLVVSMLAVTYKAFDVTIDKIPVGGISFSFDNRVFVFLIFISLAYFFLTFALYYFIDIKNAVATDHQRSSVDNVRVGLERFSYTRQQAIFYELSRLYPKYTFEERGHTIGELLSLIQTIGFRDTPSLYRYQKRPTVDRFKITPKINAYESPIALTSSDYRKMYLDCARIIRKRARLQKIRYLIFGVKIRSQLLAIKLVYFVRNYITDGLLPIFLGIFAFASLYELVPLEWIRHIAPPK